MVPDGGLVCFTSGLFEEESLPEFKKPDSVIFYCKCASLNVIIMTSLYIETCVLSSSAPY